MPYVEVEPGVQLFYRELGQGRPVVFVHGWSLSHEVWDAQMTALHARYRVVALDCRGHGDSDKPAGDYSIAQHARDTSVFLEELDLRNVTLVGWSRGGAIAAKTAADYPDRIVQLVLVGAAVPRTVSAPDFPLGHPPESRRARVEHERTDRAGYRWWLVERCVHRPVGELTMRWLWQLSMKMPGWVALTTIEGGLHEDLRPDIPKIKAPTLILHGRHDPLCPIDLGRWTTERLAGSRLVEFAESGHSPFLEEADRFNDELEAFLAEVNGAISRSTGEPASP